MAQTDYISHQKSLKYTLVGERSVRVGHLAVIVPMSSESFVKFRLIDDLPSGLVLVEKTGMIYGKARLPQKIRTYAVSAQKANGEVLECKIRFNVVTSTYAGKSTFISATIGENVRIVPDSSGASPTLSSDMLLFVPGQTLNVQENKTDLCKCTAAKW